MRVYTRHPKEHVQNQTCLFSDFQGENGLGVFPVSKLTAFVSVSQLSHNPGSAQSSASAQLINNSTKPVAKRACFPQMESSVYGDVCENFLHKSQCQETLNWQL